MITLGIETSCDETSVAVTDGNRVLSNVVSSSVRMHKKYGGVVPEIASRFHVEYIVEVLSKALTDSAKTLKDVKLVAVTNGPGLVGALLTGVSIAKSISYSLKVPLIGVNHVLAHLYSPFLNGKAAAASPFVGLVVSGGHTALFYCRSAHEQKILGQTQDDAVGEAYDKVAKLLGLGYPGGPVIEKMASRASGHTAIAFPRSYLGKDSLDFSFSGIKTAVLYYVRKHLVDHPSTGLGTPFGRRPQTGDHRPETVDHRLICDICYAFQEAALDAVVEKACRASKMSGVKCIVVGGGVAANSRLRQKLSDAGAFSGIEVYFPDKCYCMDNAAMIGYLGEALYSKGRRSDMYLSAEPNLEAR